MFERLKGSDDAIVIAEVGQNHQGSFDTAMEYIRRLSTTGTDFVKFQGGITSHSLRQRRTTKLMKVKMLLDLLMENIVKNLN